MSTPAACYRHPERHAVEQCEVCAKPVCGACLWYAEGGQRLCPDDAAERLHAGQTVVPPERYSDAIVHSQASAARPAQAAAPYQGNSTDLTALAAAIAGLSALLACAGLAWVMPLLAFVLGLVAWLQYRDALDPRRARWLSLVGLTGGSLFVLSILAIMGLFAICFILQFALLSSAGGGPRFPTPFPTVPFTTPIP
jgi:hypothetical protein